MLKLIGVYQGLTWWNPFMNRIFHLRDMCLWTNVYVRATIVAFVYDRFFLYTILVAKGILLKYLYCIVTAILEFFGNLMKKSERILQWEHFVWKMTFDNHRQHCLLMFSNSTFHSSSILISLEISVYHIIIIKLRQFSLNYCQPENLPCSCHLVYGLSGGISRVRQLLSRLTVLLFPMIIKTKIELLFCGKGWNCPDYSHCLEQFFSLRKF